MAQSFSGNATIASGNGTKLLASSTVYYANGTTVINGNAPVYFDTYLTINPGTNGGNISLLPTISNTTAANMPFGAGLAGASGAIFTVPPLLTQNGNAAARPDANQTYFAASASTAVTFMGM